MNTVGSDKTVGELDGVTYSAIEGNAWRNGGRKVREGDTAERMRRRLGVSSGND